MLVPMIVHDYLKSQDLSEWSSIPKYFDYFSVSFNKKNMIIYYKISINIRYGV